MGAGACRVPNAQGSGSVASWQVLPPQDVEIARRKLVTVRDCAGVPSRYGSGAVPVARFG
jgi:hypothetical protein